MCEKRNLLIGENNPFFRTEDMIMEAVYDDRTNSLLKEIDLKIQEAVNRVMRHYEGDISLEEYRKMQKAIAEETAYWLEQKREIIVHPVPTYIVRERFKMSFTHTDMLIHYKAMARNSGVKYSVWRRHYMRLCRATPKNCKSLLKFFKLFSARHNLSCLYPMLLKRGIF